MVSVVIVGGTERMIRRYEELCKSYACKVKVYIEIDKGIQNFGSPDLLVLFTSTMSHKMLTQATGQAKRRRIPIARSHTSSMTALKNILDTHVSGGVCRV